MKKFSVRPFMILLFVASLLFTSVSVEQYKQAAYIAPISGEQMRHGTFLAGLIPSAEAQSVPIPNGQIGPVPIHGAVAHTGTGTSALFASAGTGLRNYIYQAQCVNTSASTVIVMGLVDGNGSTPKTYIPCPAAGANTAPITFNPPLRMSAGSQVTTFSGTAVSTAYIWASGYTSR